MLSKRYSLAEPRAATAPEAAVAIPKLPHFSQFLLGAKNCAKCSWRSNPGERCATSGLAVLATHRPAYLRPPQLSHFLLEARKSANCCMRRRADGSPATRVAFPATYGHVTLCAGRGAHIEPCPTSFVRRQPFRKPSPPIAQSPPHYVLVTVPAYRFAAGTVPSTPFAPGGTRFTRITHSHDGAFGSPVHYVPPFT